MSTFRIALANLRFSATPEESVTLAQVRPDGTLLSYQPYGQEGLLIADIDIAAATGLLAARCQPTA